MQFTKIYTVIIVAVFILAYSSCSRSLEWPSSPLISFPESDPNWLGPQNKEQVMKHLEGHYAHYDVVANEDLSSKTPIKTFIISYGFTDFFIENGKLYQVDTFCHAEQKINQKFVKTYFEDESVQAIKPRVQEVDIFFEKGIWHLYRPASPTLLGVIGDPSLPLSRNPDDPRLTDPDNDGNPGVTVKLVIGGIFRNFLYITRREIYENHLLINSDGNLYGSVEDKSEQFVIDASLEILKQQTNPVQLPDRKMNPLILIRISDDIDTCAELMEKRDLLFPEEPDFQ